MRQSDTPLGPSTFEQTTDTICTGDVLVHTWDLARATGLDERLDPEEVHRATSPWVGVDDSSLGGA
jgi:hypothetical protein